MPISDIDAQTDAGQTPAPSDAGAAEPRRVLFYSHDGTGLGHLRITLGVATAYAALRPRDSLLLLTGSAHAGSYALPRNLDYVKIPAMPKRDLYASLPPTEGYTGSHNSTIRFRTAVARATVEAFDPHLVVVDHAPAGLFREFVPSLEWLKARGHARLALLMRDITFGAEQTREIWTNERVYPLLDGHYDQILIYGDRQVFDPIEAYAMPEGAAARTRFCGYLAPLPPRRSPDEARAAIGADSLPLVVVSVGGGADGAPLLRAYLLGLRERTGPPVHSYVVTGPLLPESEREEIMALARDLPNVRIVAFDPDFAAALQAADAVVSMGGYNSLAEAVYFGKRPVVVPRIPGPLEQVLRAEGFARLGHAVAIEPTALTPTLLWDAIDRELRGGQPATRALPFDGLQQIALALAEPFEGDGSQVGVQHRGDCESN